MSSGKKKKNNKNNKNNRNRYGSKSSYKKSGAVKRTEAQGNNSRKRLSAEQPASGLSAGRNEILAAIPGLMMFLMMLIMLFADIAADDPQSQYELFPAVFKVVDIVSVTSGILFIGIMAADREKRRALAHSLKAERVWIFFAAFLFLILISTCINGLTEGAIHGIPYRNIGVFSMAAFILIYMGVTGCIRAERLRWIFLVAFSVVADLIALSALYDLYIGTIPAYHAKKELSTIFFNGNHYGYFLVMAVLIGFGAVLYTDGWQIALGAVTAVLNGWLLVINHSLGCIIAVTAAAFIAVITSLATEPERRKRAGIAVGIAVSLAILVLIISPAVQKEIATFGKDLVSIISGQASGTEGHNRIRVWSRTWSYITEKPVFGFGCEGMSERLYIGTGISNPHNEILTYAAYYGIPAAMSYAAGVIAIFVRYFRGRKQATASQKTACMAAAGYFISSLTGVAMFYLTPLFFTLLGFAALKSRTEQR